MAFRSGAACPPFALLLVALLAATGCASTGMAPSSATGFGAAAPEVERLLRMADGAERDGNLAIAANFYARALSLAPANAGLAVRLGGLLLDAGDAGPAAEAFAQALATDPDSVEAAKGQGKALLAAGRQNDAVPRLKGWHERLPNDVDLIKLLAVAYDLQKEHAKAIPLYEKGLVLDPASLSLRSNYGLSLAFSGDARAGIAVLKPLAEGRDSDPRLRQNLALAYGLAGDMEAAERLSRLDLTPDEVEGNLSLFRTLRSSSGGKLYPTDIQTGFEIAKSPRPSKAPRAAPSATPRDVHPAAPSAAMSPAAPGATPPARILTPTKPAKASPPPLQAPGAAPVGMSLEGGRIGLAPFAAEAGPSEVWYLDLGAYPSEAEAASAWRAIEAAQPGLRRLAGDCSSLIVGPLQDPAGAGSLCEAAQAERCVPTRI